MNSNDRSELLDLERGLPTTGRDVDALRALRYPKMTDAQYVRFRGPHGARSRDARREARTAGRSFFPLSGLRVALDLRDESTRSALGPANQPKTSRRCRPARRPASEAG